MYITYTLFDKKGDKFLAIITTCIIPGFITTSKNPCNKAWGGASRFSVRLEKIEDYYQ